MSCLRSLILVLCLVFLVIVQGPMPAQTQTDVNKVLNGGFEEPDPDTSSLRVIDHWTPVDAASEWGARAANPTAPETLSFHPICTDSSCHAEYYQAVDVTQCRGGTLDLTGHLLVSTENSWDPCQIAWRLSGSADCATGGDLHVVGTCEDNVATHMTWFPVTTEVDIPASSPNAQDYVCLYISGDKNTVYIDDISLVSEVTAVRAVGLRGWTGGGLALAIALLAGSSVGLWRWRRRR